MTGWPAIIPRTPTWRSHARSTTRKHSGLFAGHPVHRVLWRFSERLTGQGRPPGQPSGQLSFLTGAIVAASNDCVLSPDPWIDLHWRSAGQPELFCSSEQVLDGGRVPPGATARRALAHGLELSGDLLQGALRRCGGDTRDEPDQPVVALLAGRAFQQGRLDDALRHQPPYGAAQPLNGPGGLGGAVQNAHDIAPRLSGTHPPHGRQPRVQLRQDAIKVCGVAASTDLTDCVGVTGAQAGISADTTAAARGAPPGPGALRDQCPLELCDGAQHLQREHALWRGGVEGIAQAAEMRPLRLELLDDGEQVADRAGEAVEPDHDQSFAGADLA